MEKFRTITEPVSKRDQWRKLPVGESVIIDANKMRIDYVRVELCKLGKEGLKFSTSTKNLPKHQIKITRVS